MKLELVRFVWFLGYPRIPKLNQLLFKFVKLTRESSFIIFGMFYSIYRATHWHFAII